MNYLTKFFLVAVIGFTIAGCGGGGPAAGECLFSSASGCSGSNSSGTSTPPPVASAVSPTAPIPVQPAFTQSGVGDTQFVLPAAVTFVSITANYPGSSSNFILYANNDLIVNELIGSSVNNTTFKGSYAVSPGATIRITSSNGASWNISSFTPAQPSTAMLTASGVGDQVFYLPNRSSTYRIRASYPSASQNFIVYANDALVVNEILGTSNTPAAYDGIIAMPAFAQVEIRGSPGIIWEVSEIR